MPQVDVIRILRKRAWEMLHSCKVLRTFELLCVFWENPSREKWRKNCTGFSAEFFGFQSVQMFCFARKTKIQTLITSSRSLTRIHQRFLKSLGLYNFRLSLNSKGVHTIQQALGDKSLNHETTVSKNKSEMSLKLIREVLVMAI